MRASVTSLSKKIISMFFAAVLAVGLMPATAFAVDDAVEEAVSVEQGGTEALIDGDEARNDIVDSAVPVIPAGEIINETQPLQVVAQQESTKSYFLAQTLEDTRTVPVVSANLPLDKEMVEDAAMGDDGEAPDTEASEQLPAIAIESVVVGSFEQGGLVYAIEPGGDSVAVVATDYAKLSLEVVESHTLEIPFMATSDGIDYYSVTRIADNAFAGLASKAGLQQDQAADENVSIGTDSASATSDEPDAVEEGATSEMSSIDIVSAVVELTDGADSEQTDVADDADAIMTLVIPASVTTIEDDAFAGFDTLQYIVVSSDNPNYSSYDGCLYTADLTSLLLIPEGRTGAVRIASSVTIDDSEVFSHCPSGVTLVADADGAASAALGDVDAISIIGDESAENLNLEASHEELGGAYDALSLAERITEAATTPTNKPNVLSSSTVYRWIRLNGSYSGNAYDKPGEASYWPWLYGSSARLVSNAGSYYLELNGITRDPDETAGATKQYNIGPSRNGNYSVYGVTKAWLVSKTSSGTYSGQNLSTTSVSLADKSNVSIYLNDYGNFTINFNSNGGSSVSALTNVKPFDTSRTFSTPTRAGYKFDGWYTSASGGSKVTCPQWSGATYYAHWTGNTITLNWNSNGGSAVSSTTQIYADGAKVTPTKVVPTRPGYTFKGWYTSTTGNTLASSGSLPTSGSATYYAQWTGNTIKLTWNSNGGSSVNATTQTYADGAKVTLPATAPTRENYSFRGWYTSQIGGTRVTGETALPNENTTYNAQWVKTPPSVYFYSPTNSIWRYIQYNTGSFTGTTEFSTAKGYNPDGHALSLKLDTDHIVMSALWLNDDANEGTYRIGTTSSGSRVVSGVTKAWVVGTDIEGTKIGCALGSTATSFDQFERIDVYLNGYGSFDVFFDPNGGDGDIQKQSGVMPYDASVTFPTPTWTGYIFEGWFTAPEGGDRVTMVEGSGTTYFAHWVEQAAYVKYYASAENRAYRYAYSYGADSYWNVSSYGFPYGPQSFAISLRLVDEQVIMHSYNSSWGGYYDYFIGLEQTGDRSVGGVKSAWLVGTYPDGTTVGIDIGVEPVSSSGFTTLAVYLNGYGAVTASFDPNGGDGSMVTKTMMLYQDLSEIPTPTKEGFAFAGWFTSPTGGDFITNVGETDGEYYAHWVYGQPRPTVYASTAISRWIQLSDTGEAYSKTSQFSAPYRPLLTVHSLRLMSECLEMRGTQWDQGCETVYYVGIDRLGNSSVSGVTTAWLVTTDSAGDKQGVALGSDWTSVDESSAVEVYLNQYGAFDLSFNSNGGNEDIQTVSNVMPYGPWTAPSATRPGYTITGWYDGPGNDANIVCAADGAGPALPEATTLFAHWAPVSAAVVPLNVTAKVDMLGVADQEAVLSNVLDDGKYQGYIESRSAGALDIVQVDFEPFAGAETLFGDGRDRVLLEALAEGSSSTDYSFALHQAASETDTAKLAPFSLDAGIGTRKHITYRFDIPDDVLAAIDRNAFNNKTTSIGRVAYTVAVAD